MNPRTKTYAFLCCSILKRQLLRKENEVYQLNNFTNMNNFFFHLLSATVVKTDLGMSELFHLDFQAVMCSFCVIEANPKQHHRLEKEYILCLRSQGSEFLLRNHHYIHYSQFMIVLIFLLFSSLNIWWAMLPSTTGLGL